MMIFAPISATRLERPRKVAGALAFLGLAVAGLSYVVHPVATARAYLVALIFWLGISVGSLALFMLHNLVGGGWGFLIRRHLEAAAGTIWILALMFIPVVLTMSDLYVWSNPLVRQDDPGIARKAGFLAPGTFVLRGMCYFLVWIVLDTILRRWSRIQDDRPSSRLLWKMQYASALGLVAHGLVVTFSSIDWVMSMQPRFGSTIFGMIFMVAQVLGALSLSIVFALSRVEASATARREVMQLFQDLGNLLFAFIVLWGYLMFSQYLVTWAADLPEETPWYLLRREGAWAALAFGLVVFHFAIPLLLLLSKSVKRVRGRLAALALALTVFGVFGCAFLVSPPEGVELGPLDWSLFGAVLGIGGFWFLAFMSILASRPLIPAGDPRLPPSLRPGEVPSHA